ncbi:hypothetical protein FF011L_33410 [Roseimaritima multifibrata]|uniref:SEC-C motif-containing protein n=1 Tax=Roseimaritima multifibrata TaxID=1930274 RepID=A0A517MI55_9BACT|nr:SEC-C metal-binding domain-containing protein [Roseimaritima multifibrata]QDS94562.1 hypothetical protein FF011L_33410 [Roseimaritima multifibrata]
MYLTEKEILASLDYPSLYVRETLREYFNGRLTPPIELTHKLIALIDDEGWNGVFGYPQQIIYCQQDKTSLEWCFEQIDQCMRVPTDPKKGVNALLFALVEWTIRAPLQLLVPYEDRIESHHAFQQIYFSETNPTDTLKRRIKLESLTAEQAWPRVEKLCDLLANSPYYPENCDTDINFLLESLAADGDNSRDKLINILRDPNGDHDGAHGWMVSTMMALAGRMRFNDAVPHILDRMRRDKESYRQRGGTAITNIGTPDAHQKVIEFYLGQPRNVRIYLESSLEHIHYPAAAKNLLPLLKSVKDSESKVQLAITMVSQFDDIAIEPAIKVYAENPQDGDRHVIIDKLNAFAYVAELEFPDLVTERRNAESVWMIQLANMRDLNAKRCAEGIQPDQIEIHHVGPEGDLLTQDFTTSDTPRITKSDRVGRNDPCPCGSGLKYKKCCINKAM